MRSERGSILAQVLILTAVASLMCASILRARFQPALTSSRAVERVQDDLTAQAAVNRVTASWIRGGSCATDPRAGILCWGKVPCDCSCEVSSLDTRKKMARVTAKMSAGVCRLTASSE
jgi:hypothetical protein